MIANLPLDNLRPLRALATRIPVLHFQPTNEEIAALMRQIAQQGYIHNSYRLEAKECQEVAEAIIVRSVKLQRNLDLRLLINTFNDRLQWMHGDCESHWLDLLDSRLKQRTLSVTKEHRGRRAAEQERKLALVGRIMNLARHERISIWTAETGQSEQAYYTWREKYLAANSSFQDSTAVAAAV